ncbi:MAG: hypothetical protein Q4G26_12370 [Paracoccus sp. (in: a-proteobacteria)]|nr:hypothetical protein [Paracoccus sp. (in: a-proteobacteria)]
MGNISIRELRQMGVSREDIDMARATQEAQRRNGSPVQSIAVIVGVSQPYRRSNGVDIVTQCFVRGRNPIEFNDKALRKRGRYGQAALLLDQVALSESSPERAARARELAKGAKELDKPVQLEFDFFGGGNVSLAFQYQDAVTERLNAAAPTVAMRDRALATLWQITRNLAWQSYECSKTAADLIDVLGYDKGDMARTLQLLEDVGAIRRVKRGRTKIITVTPEGAFRGNINEHARAVEKYRLEVIEGGRDV